MVKHKSADYRGMAERCSAEASKVTDAAAKARLLEIASQYDRIADWVERHEPAIDGIL
jgi:hypothetical protein